MKHFDGRALLITEAIAVPLAVVLNVIEPGILPRTWMDGLPGVAIGLATGIICGVFAWLVFLRFIARKEPTA